MHHININTQFISYNTIDELPENIKKLMLCAIDARENAYAPYSQFKVGAAILLEDDAIVTGSNQENAAYPSGLCAERVAVFATGANHPSKKIIAICISGSSNIKETLSPIPPCGACRQSLLEYENKQNQIIPVYFMGKLGEVIKSPSIQNLLPFIFKEDSL